MARVCGPRQVVKAGCIDATMTFAICSKIIVGRMIMTKTSTKNRSTKNRTTKNRTTKTFSTTTLLMAAALSVLATSAFAQAAAPTPWELKPDMGYGYDKEGKTFSYKMGTKNAGLLLKGAKKVPKGTLFFIGQNGQLYMRTGPYLEGDGKFMFGSN
jgi:hypothetical protein